MLVPVWARNINSDSSMGEVNCMKLIDADALIDKFGDWYIEEGTEEGYIGTMKGIVDSMPTIEPERNCTDCRFTFYAKAEEGESE